MLNYYLNKISIFQLKSFFKSYKFNLHILLLLVATDLAFIILYLFTLVSRFKYNFDFTGLGFEIMNMLYNIEEDYSYAEFFQYMKEYFICLIFLYLSIKNKNLSYFSWSLFFLYILIDDSLSFHETFGKYLTKKLSLKSQFGLPDKDIGELIVSITFGILFLILFLISHYLTKFRTLKETLHIGVLVLILVFFGVVVDMLHVLSFNINYLVTILGLIEDGGEMVVMSLLTSFSFYLFSIKKNHN